jgi:glutamine synthetase adenylyltransferase
MGFWAWFWIWSGLVLASLAVFGLLGKSLLNKTGDVLHQVERIMTPAQKLAETLAVKPELTDKESDLLTPASELEAERSALLKKKSKKQAARQRSLREALKHIDVNESRFTND